MDATVDRTPSICNPFHFHLYTEFINERNAIEIGWCEKNNVKYLCANAFNLCVLEIPLICSYDLRQRTYYELQSSVCFASELHSTN